MLKKEINKPLSDVEIKKAFDDKIHVYTYDEIQDFKRIEDLLYPYNKCIILYVFNDDKNESMGHYVGLTSHNNKNVFFDSYGRNDKQILNTIEDDIKMLNDEDYPKITELLKKSNDPIVINKKKLQDDDSATCGRWCSFILEELPKFRSLEDLLKSFNFTNDTKHNDKEIVKLTQFYFK